MNTEKCPKCKGLNYLPFAGKCEWCNEGRIPAPRTLKAGMQDIHDGIDTWHVECLGESWGLSLHEFLGLTWLEYRVWVNYHRLPEHTNWFDPDREGFPPGWEEGEGQADGGQGTSSAAR